ncbi:MAG: hypothetical protein U1F20_03300 [Lysobacterales bacterium]
MRRLVLLMHYEWFDLDYSVQALVGILFAFANLAVLWCVIAAPEDAAPARRAVVPRRLSPWRLAASYLAQLGMIYTWPLMTMAFSNQFFVLPAHPAGVEGEQRCFAAYPAC